MRSQHFFNFARERHSIYLRRQAGLPRSAWTEDPILQTYRFTNVFRELDATTVWFRKNVRDPLRDSPDVLLATVLFRWFNRVTTGEAIFLQRVLGEGGQDGGYLTPWEWLVAPDVSVPRALGVMRSAIQCYCGDGPYVTGAYIIKTPDGKNKLDGVLWCVEQFMRGVRKNSAQFAWNWRAVAAKMIEYRGRHTSLEATWEWLRQSPFLGDFMAYEIVTDLRHTAMLDEAPDIMTWANPGPGAARGLNRVHGRPVRQVVSREQKIREMWELLNLSRSSEFWPQGDPQWPSWEMRDVEHTLCEWDKMERVASGQGRPKQKYW